MHTYAAKSRDGPIPVSASVLPIPVIIESIDISNLMYQIPDYIDTQNRPASVFHLPASHS